MKENIYEIGYSDYDGSPSCILTNNKEYTQVQFNDLVIDAIKDIIPKLEEEGYTKNDIAFEDCYPLLLNTLKNNFGFIILEPSIKFFPNGDLFFMDNNSNDILPTDNDNKLLVNSFNIVENKDILDKY